MVSRRSRVALGAFGGLVGLPLAYRGLVAWRVRRLHRSLTPADAPPERFDPESVAALPDPARRYLERAVDPGTPCWRTVRLDMRGQFRLGDRWRPLDASETLTADRGFIWEASIRLGRIGRVSGVDSYVDGTGGQQFFLGGLVPMAAARGRDVSRSGAGRFLGEHVWLPTALVPREGIEWTGVDARRARVRATETGEAMSLTVADDGRLESASLRRVRGETGERERFVVTVAESRSFDGVTVPSRVTARWADDPPFFRVRIEDAAFE